MRVRRICSGEYEYSYRNRVVTVSRIPPNEAYGDTKEMWIASALWSNTLYSDPLETKREAVAVARNMLDKG